MFTENIVYIVIESDFSLLNFYFKSISRLAKLNVSIFEATEYSDILFILINDYFFIEIFKLIFATLRKKITDLNKKRHITLIRI